MPNSDHILPDHSRGRLLATGFLAGLTVSAFLLLHVQSLAVEQQVVDRLSTLDRQLGHLSDLAVLSQRVTNPANVVFATGDVQSARAQLRALTDDLDRTLDRVEVSAEDSRPGFFDPAAVSALRGQLRQIGIDSAATLSAIESGDRSAALQSRLKVQRASDDLLKALAEQADLGDRLRRQEIERAADAVDSRRVAGGIIGLLSIVTTIAITFLGQARRRVAPSLRDQTTDTPIASAMLATPAAVPTADENSPTSAPRPIPMSRVGERTRELERQTLGPALRLAVERDEIQVAYLPEIELATLRVSGVEALTRWVHPERGVLSPQAFLSLADDSGVITRIGRTVLRQAVQAGRRWYGRGEGATVEISINLTANQLEDPTTLPFLTRVLEQAGLPPNAIVIDIPEQVFLTDLAATERRVAALRAIGVRIGIDDVGVGYSQLSSLDQLPVDVLKISRSVIERCGRDDDALAVVDGMIWFGNERQLKVVAKGVERFDQLDALWSVGCHYAQGYFFSEPIPAREVDALLAGGTLPITRWQAPAA